MEPTFLDKIIAKTRQETAQKRQSLDLHWLRDQALESRSSRTSNLFYSFLARHDQVNVIAEIKRASPSKGVINADIDVAETARAYENGGAAAISVLTEPEYFRGSLDDLRDVRFAVDLPLLRKDFIVDEIQIWEAAIAGADAVLLIVAALENDEIIALRERIEALGMDALVEVHTQDELDEAITAGARTIGVNNRDLHSLEVSLDVSRRLIKRKPDGVIMVAESGITSRSDIDELRSLGFDGFLIGESLMRSSNAAATLEAWT